MNTTLLTNVVKAEPQCTSKEAAEIRALLPGQAARAVEDQRRARIQSEFGLIYSGEQVEKELLARLPHRFGRQKGICVTEVSTYTEFIPDAALLAYHRARQSELFKQFYILAPCYLRINWSAADPWLVGALESLGGWVGDLAHLPRQEFVILAYWD